MVELTCWTVGTHNCVVIETFEPEQTCRTSFFDIISLMNANKFRRLPVVKNKELIGIITTHDIIRVLNETPTVRDVFCLDVERMMTPDPITISPNSSIQEAAKIMASNMIGCLPIISNSHKTLLGIITERDCLDFFPTTREEPIKDICSSREVITVNPSTSLKKGIEAMAKASIRHLIIINPEGSIAGIITATDIINSLGKVVNKELDANSWINLPVELLATRKTFMLPVDTPINLVSKIMKLNNIGAFPIIEKGKLFGIVSERDFVKAMAEAGE